MTSAAVVMVAVFAIFATLSMIDIKQMGVGLAVAILIDATIVRAVLLPAIDEAARRVELVPAALAAVAAHSSRGGGARARGVLTNPPRPSGAGRGPSGPRPLSFGPGRP